MKIKLEHYSRKKRQAIDPKFMGSANAGAERHRTNKIPRAYWYRAGTIPENQFRGYIKHVWEGELDIYDVGEDLLCVTIDPPYSWEEMLKDLGYDGYYNSMFYPDIIAVFRALKV